jgi:hypothetical protein
MPNYDMAETFLRELNSVKAVITYLLKHHPEWQTKPICFRGYTLNPFPCTKDANGSFVIDITDANFKALQNSLYENLNKKYYYLSWLFVYAILATATPLWYFFAAAKKTVEFCIASVQMNSNEIVCDGLTPNWNCQAYQDASFAPDVCLDQERFCPSGSFSHCSWGDSESLLNDPSKTLRLTLMSCDCDLQTKYLIFALILTICGSGLFLFFGYHLYSDGTLFPLIPPALPNELKQNWDNVQRFFHTSKNHADYSVPAETFDLKSDNC